MHSARPASASEATAKQLQSDVKAKVNSLDADRHGSLGVLKR